MGNVLRVLKRDFVRLLKAPAALVVVGALLILPSLYTWYNVVGFWNPYDNTSNMHVEVVNQDAGATNELIGDLNVGDMIEEELHQNNQLGWQFNDYDTAMQNLESGKSYAAFVIPEDFSACMLTLATGNFVQPNLQYYVNEKAGPVGPKITDAGSTQLDETINSMFVATVSDVAVEAINGIVSEADAALSSSSSRAVEQVNEAISALEGVRGKLSEAESFALDAQAKIGQTRVALGDARAGLQSASESLVLISDVSGRLGGELSSYSSALVPTLSQGMSLISQSGAAAHTAASEAIGNLQTAQAQVSATLDQARVALAEGQAMAQHIRELAGALPDDDASKEALLAAADRLDAQNARASELVDELVRLNELTARALADAQASADSFNQAASDLSGSVEASFNVLFGSVIPAANDGLVRMSATTSRLAGMLSSQNVLLDQAELVVDQLASTLDGASSALAQTNALLSDIQQDADSVRTDIQALESADVASRLVGEGGLDAGKIAEFMGSPTEVRTEQLYPLNAYGSAMAPLFMNLTFWIGAFMLLVIMKQEVDGEGVAGLTLSQRYIARFSLFAILAVIQAVICCTGLLAIGVQVANIPALYVAASVASLTYLSIIYALSVTLQHIGKGLCIILVFAQIPGATGLYPIEMTSWFFQTVYPLFPFTYGIGAMREAICGFYETQYFGDLTALLVFFVLFMALGLLVRPLMSNVNRMVARQVSEGEIFAGENAEVPMRPYRVTQIMRALSDKEEYRAELVKRYERFIRWYPRFIRASIVCGIAVPVALMVVFALTPADKVVLLTVWLVLLVATMVFLIVVESLRYSFERQLDLGDMSDQSLFALYSARNDMGRVSVGAGAAASAAATAATAAVVAAPAAAAATGAAGANPVSVVAVPADAAGTNPAAVAAVPADAISTNSVAQANDAAGANSTMRAGIAEGDSPDVSEEQGGDRRA